MAHWRYRPSQHDSDLPTEPVTLIDLPYTRRYLASTFRGPAPPPSEPSDHADSSEALASKLAKAPAW
jgi:hypothetical protein